MSELTKEKIYKNELIKAGAEGNNNLERIRSLAGGGKKKEYTIERIANDQSYRRNNLTTLVRNGVVWSFGGNKLAPTVTPTNEVTSYQIENGRFESRSIMPNQVLNPIILDYCGSFLYIFAQNNTAYIYSLPILEAMGSSFEQLAVCALESEINQYLIGAFIDGARLFIVDNYFHVAYMEFTLDESTKELSIVEQGVIPYIDERPSNSLTCLNSWMLGGKIYIYCDDNAIYSYTFGSTRWVKETTLTDYTMVANCGCLIGKDYYFTTALEYGVALHKLDSVTFEVEDIKVDEQTNYALIGGAELFDFGGEIGIAGGTAVATHYEILKIVEKQ